MLFNFKKNYVSQLFLKKKKLKQKEAMKNCKKEKYKGKKENYKSYIRQGQKSNKVKIKRSSETHILSS